MADNEQHQPPAPEKDDEVTAPRQRIPAQPAGEKKFQQSGVQKLK